jgi:Tfp pilus assembly protein PilW
MPPPDAAFLERAWSVVAEAAAAADVAVVLGTERIVDGKPRITALVIDRDGTMAGFQDKVQLDPSEESTYSPGSERRCFQAGPLTFGVAICHEGWRYCAIDGSPTTSAVVRPDGVVQAWQPYGQDGLLVTDVDTESATGLLAARWRCT